MKKHFGIGRILSVLFLLFVLSFFLWKFSNSHLPHRIPDQQEEAAEKLKPNDWFYLQRSYPERQLDYRAWRAAWQQAQFFRQQQSLETMYWTSAGPTNIGGRVTCIAVHPSQPNRIWIGAADGGVWVSGNGGVEWTPVFDFNQSLSIGALAIDPNDPNTVYVGTGEANASGDSYPGNGLFRTTDGGLTWQYLGLEHSYYIARIAINPQNTQNIFVAATGLLFGKNPERGIYRTLDGGNTWERVLYISDSTAAIDVVINPVNPNIVYAAMWERIRRPNHRQAGGITSGIYKSTDGGTTWTQLTNGLPPNSPTVGRIGLTISPSNPDVLYAIYADHPGYFMGLYKTVNGGSSWFSVGSGLSQLFSSYGWYFGQVYVDPSNPNIVYALGLDLYKSTNGGATWNNIGWSMHVDHHAIWVDPNDSNHLIVGNDGGVYISQNGGASFNKVNYLPITQFYAGTVDFNHPEKLYGGTQDNGTVRTPTGQLNDWEEIYGGDGFYVIVDPNNSNIIYAEYQYGGLGKSTDGGYFFSSATNGINSNDRRNWMVPVVMDPNNSNILYYGTYRVYRTVDGAGYWSPISSDLSNGPYPGGLSYGTITAIAVAPSNPNTVYAGTDDGNVWCTDGSISNWVNISGTLPQRWVTSIAVHPSNDQVALVTYSGYKHNEYIGYIFRTTDKGQTWTDITGNLPQAPINKVIIDPDYPHIYYIGTDVGVFFTPDSGTTWQMLGQNLPNSVVMDLILHQPTRTLVAVTHGRSMYKIDISGISEIAQGRKISIPRTVILTQNYPNPFNNRTQISFYLPHSMVVDVSIFNARGQKVRNLIQGTVSGGWHQIHWDGTNQLQQEVSSGTYFCRLRSEQGNLVRKLIFLK